MLTIYFLIAVSLIALGMAFFGLRTAAFGSGYPLIGGRESFGMGARLAGTILLLPLLGSVIFVAILLSDRERGKYIMDMYQALVMAVAGGGFVLLFAISYILAEFTHMPYWQYMKNKEGDEDEEEEDEEKLTSKQKRKKQSKLEKKLEKARQKEEQKRRELEEEQERLKRKHEDMRARRAPPPIPDDDDEDDYRRR